MFPICSINPGSATNHMIGLCKDRELNRIAGNSISIPVIGSIMACLMAGCELRERELVVPLAPTFAGPPVWVGPKRIEGSSGPFDCLTPKPPKATAVKSRAAPARAKAKAATVLRRPASNVSKAHLKRKPKAGSRKRPSACVQQTLEHCRFVRVKCTN